MIMMQVMMMMMMMMMMNFLMPIFSEYKKIEMTRMKFGFHKRFFPAGRASSTLLGNQRMRDVF